MKMFAKSLSIAVLAAFIGASAAYAAPTGDAPAKEEKPKKEKKAKKEKKEKPKKEDKKAEPK